MNIINLPQDIFPAEKTGPGEIFIHDYQAPVGSLNGKSILHMNAISLVISGEKTMHFSQRTVTIKDDEFHLLSAGNCLASVKLSNKKMFRSILIFFDNKVLVDFYVKYSALIESSKDKRSLPGEPYLAFKKDAFILHFIASLDLLFHTNTRISREMKMLKFEELMLHLLEKYPQQILSFQSAKNKDLNDLEIRKAVETNITNTISVEELAFLCNTSLSTFKRRFTKIYGTSPNKWMVQKRMELAKELLKHHHEKPGEVYHKVGYENHSSFTQSFKQVVGITPKEFQLQQLNFQQ